LELNGTVIEQGNSDANGYVVSSVSLPQNLSTGWHQLTLKASGITGASVVKSMWFFVSEARLITETTQEDPETRLAATGGVLPLENLSAGVLLLVAGMMLFVGASQMRPAGARRRTSR